MFRSRFSPKHVLSLLFCLLSLLLAACGGAASSSAPGNLNNGQPGSVGQNNATTTSLLSVPMPTTQTACPLPFLAGRVPVMRKMTLGNDPTVAYINDQGTVPGANSFAELKLYDTVKGRANADSKRIFGKSVLVHTPGALIMEAQVSADGQWVLFVTQTLSASEIQLVRMDGQGLQTLYCAPPGTVHSLQWSPDASRFIFSQAALSGSWNLSLFNMATGTVQPELVQSNSATQGYEARTWFDTNRVYVVGVYVAGVPDSLAPVPTRGLFVLDTSRGPNQLPSDLLQIIKLSSSSSCRSFDSDYNATMLITSQCSQTFPSGSGPDSVGLLSGPSSIVAQGITGGSQRKIYTSQTQAVTQVRMLGYASTSMLMTVNNLDASGGMLPLSSPNGLWKINTDGSGLTNLVGIDSFSECELNPFTQYPWANFSRDTRLYALTTQAVLSKSRSITLSVGSLSGGGPTPFEDDSANLGMLAIVGWTSM
jgi:hypothetical protein